MRYLATDAFADRFPLHRRYASLLPLGTGVRESGRGQSFRYTERHLQCVWFDDRWRPKLRTAEGEELIVVSPGRWNLESGPDFLDAVLLIGAEGRRVEGDVEVHVSPSDWQAHSHADDPRYARVALHVTYREGARATGLPPGAARVALRPLLDATPGFSLDAIDVAAYPYANPRSPAPCEESMAEWTPDERRAFLAAAGQERLRRKALRIADRIEEAGPVQTLYEDVLSALGYKHNRRPFRALAAGVPLDELAEAAGSDPFAFYALLAGLSGLLPERPSPRWAAEAREFVRKAWGIWWRSKAAWETRGLRADQWTLAHLRPANHPLRRMAAAAALFHDPRALLQRLEAPDGVSPSARIRGFVDFLCRSQAIPFWTKHVSLGAKPSARPLALLGAGRAGAIVTNVFVPFLAARGRDIAPLLDALPAEDDHALIRETASDLFGRDHNPAEYRHGLLQQGLTQICHDFCLQRRNGCAGCDLPTQLRGTSQSR